MPVSPIVSAVFGHFHNLNLLVLLQHLRDGRAARHAWFTGARLCPVAHGLQAWQIQILSKPAELGPDCDFAARHLGADPEAVQAFVRAWDEDELSAAALLRQLEEVWGERLEDAIAVQELLQFRPTAVAE